MRTPDAVLVYTREKGWHAEASQELEDIIRGGNMNGSNPYASQPIPALSDALQDLRDGKGLLQTAARFYLAPGTLRVAARAARINYIDELDSEPAQKPQPRPDVPKPAPPAARTVDSTTALLEQLRGLGTKKGATLADRISMLLNEAKDVVAQAEAVKKNAARIAELEAELAKLKGRPAPSVSKQDQAEKRTTWPVIDGLQQGPECTTCGKRITRPAGTRGSMPKIHKNGCP